MGSVRRNCLESYFVCCTWDELGWILYFVRSGIVLWYLVLGFVLGVGR